MSLPNSAALLLTHAGIDRIGSIVINGVSQPDGIYDFGTSTPFQTWAFTKGLDGASANENGPGDDPDDDGLDNLGEFAFNGHPLNGADKGGIFHKIADSNDAGTEAELILTIAVRAGTPAYSGSPSPSASVDGVTCRIQGSTDLSGFGAWVSPVDPATTGVPPAGTGYEYRSFRLDGSNGLSTNGFLRAIAEMP